MINVMCDDSLSVAYSTHYTTTLLVDICNFGCYATRMNYQSSDDMYIRHRKRLTPTHTHTYTQPLPQTTRRHSVYLGERIRP